MTEIAFFFLLTSRYLTHLSFPEVKHTEGQTLHFMRWTLYIYLKLTYLNLSHIKTDVLWHCRGFFLFGCIFLTSHKFVCVLITPAELKHTLRTNWILLTVEFLVMLPMEITKLMEIYLFPQASNLPPSPGLLLNCIFQFDSLLCGILLFSLLDVPAQT